MAAMATSNLAVVRRAGRHRLQGQTRQGTRAHERIAGVRRIHAYDLVRDARDDGDEDDARRDPDGQVRSAKEREDDDGNNHHRKEERGAATRVRCREEADVVALERQVRLLGVDGHVLSGVIAEHALDARHEADKPEVGEEDAEAQDAFRGVAEDGVVREAVHEPMRYEEGQDEEEADAEHDRRREREGHRHRRDGLLVLLGLAGRDLRGPREGAHAHDERFGEDQGAADERDAAEAVDAPRGNGTSDGLDHAGGVAGSHGVHVPSADHHALNDRLAPVDGMLLCLRHTPHPPFLSRERISGGASYWRLKRLLRRSTRPSVSTMRCSPVKNGWQELQISTLIWGFVAPIVNVFPQEQVTTASG